MNRQIKPMAEHDAYVGAQETAFHIGSAGYFGPDDGGPLWIEHNKKVLCKNFEALRFEELP